MKYIAIGAHLRRDDVEPVATALQADDLFVSALELPDEQAVSDRDVILRAAAVRGRLLDRAIFVAIRYGAAVKSAAEAAEKCRPHLERWRSLLERHRDEVEMTLKVVSSTAAVRPRREDFLSGGEYLRALHGAVRGASIDPSFRAAVDEALLPLSVRQKWTHRDDASLELAMLVSRARLPEVQSLGEALKSRFPAVPFMLSGPWPLEVFSDADHE
jgi:hypothetical protein